MIEATNPHKIIQNLILLAGAAVPYPQGMDLVVYCVALPSQFIAGNRLQPGICSL